MSSENAAKLYLHRAGIAGEKPLRCIGEPGWTPGIEMMNRIGNKQEPRLKVRAAAAGQKTEDLETEERSHEGADDLPRGFWAMRGELLVCVGIVLAIGMLIAVLGVNGMIALGITLVVVIIFCVASNARKPDQPIKIMSPDGDHAGTSAAAGALPFNWEQIDQ